MADEKIGDQVEVQTAAHPPRTDSPEYIATRKWLMGAVAGGCYICGGPVDLTHPEAPADATGLQDHHGGGYIRNGVLVGFSLVPLEWSMGWGQDPAKLTAFIQQMVDAELVLSAELTAAGIALPLASITDVMKWVDSRFNANVKLCLTGDTPILMGDGRSIPLAEVTGGDYVIGHDGQPHMVTDAWSKPWRGELVVVDGVAMTPNHPVLTPRGWLRADALEPGFPVLTHMDRVAFIESEVFDPVVELVSVDVMDALSRGQTASQMSLHDQAVFHNGAPCAIVPDFAATIAGAGDRRGTLVAARQRVEGLQASLLPARSPLTRPGTRRVVLGVSGADHELSPTDLAFLDDAPTHLPLTSVGTRWRPIREIRHVQHDGRVYDMTVCGSHSFMVAEGFAVHNCAPHHVGHQTSHTPDANGHEAVGIHNAPWPILAAQAAWDWTRGDMWGGTTGTVAVSPKQDGSSAVTYVHPDHPGSLVVGQILPPTHPHSRAVHTPVVTSS